MLNFNPSALRNKDPIIQVLKSLFPKTSSSNPKNVLMVAEGSGTHLHFFSQEEHFKSWNFLATDYEPQIVEQLKLNFHQQISDNNVNIQEPRVLDSGDLESWRNFNSNNTCQYDIIYNCNMVHISPINTSVGLFFGAGKFLTPETGKLIMYGPFAFNGVLSPESNVSFDKSLKSRNPEWGIRDLSYLIELAEKNGSGITRILKSTIRNVGNFSKFFKKSISQ